MQNLVNTELLTYGYSLDSQGFFLFAMSKEVPFVTLLQYTCPTITNFIWI